jgi:uncharacterized delta-60 repeat protein
MTGRVEKRAATVSTPVNARDRAIGSTLAATFCRLLASIAALCAIASVATAGPGAVDHSFGAGFGYVRYADTAMIVEDNGLGVAVQPDGRTLVAGTSGISPGAVVLRFNADGSLDSTFGTGGVFRYEHETEIAIARRVVVQSDGKLLVLGYLQVATKLLLMRLLPNGTLDPTYGTGGITVATSPGWLTDVRRVVIDAEGRPVVIWEPLDPALNKIRVSRFTTSGQVDSDWNLGSGQTVLDTAGFGAVTVLPMGATLDPEGKLLIFASTYTASANTTLIYRLGRDGFPDPFFGNNGRLAYPQLNYAFWNRQWTVLRAGDTGFVLAEWTPAGIRFEKFNVDGTVATQFGSFGFAFFAFPTSAVTPGNALIRADGTIVVSGTRAQGGANQIFLLAVAPDGTLDTRFGTGIPQRTYRGEDISRPPGIVGADIALADGNGFAFAGSALNPAGLSDVLAMRVDAIGARNTAFGGSGAVTWDGGDLVPESAQGFWLQTGNLLTLNRTATGWNWRRFLPDGSPDTSFGNGGKRVLADNWDGPNTQILTQADGRIVVARQLRAPAFASATRIVRYLPNGDRDLSFGTGGAIDFIDDAQEDPVRPGLAQLDDGKLLVATHTTNGMRLRRFLVNGGIDVTFGDGNGLVYPALHGRPQVSYTLAIQPDGRILVGGATTVIRQLPLPQINVYSDVVARLNPDGSLDASFGAEGGVVPIQIENARDPQILRILPLANGKTIVAGNIARLGVQQFFFLRLNADGTTDTDFGDHTDGADGPGPFIWSNPFRTELRDAVIDAQGRLVITGSYGKSTDGRTQVFVVRFLQNGTIDGPFGGINQHIFLFERPDPTGAGNVLALAGNSIFVAGEAGEFGLILKLEADGSSVTIASQVVVEFYNTALGHYFITADMNEAAAIDAGAAGPGWERTGFGFRAWTATSGIAANAVPVCRFYGTPGVGPNSHFYTADPLECDATRNDPGWRYEEIAFYSVTPQGGACPAGMQSVLRVYNNRFAQNDSNHRYTTNQSIYQAMQQQHWLPEGVVLCSPTQ